MSTLAEIEKRLAELEERIDKYYKSKQCQHQKTSVDEGSPEGVRFCLDCGEHFDEN